MKRIPKTLRCIALFAGVATQADCALAESNPAYSHERSSSVGNPDWMSTLPGGRKVSELSIPGTHDSGTGEYRGIVPSVETQTLSLADQLESGIRAIDIRCHPDGNAFRIYHGIVPIGISFDDVLQTLTRFLSQHPGETVLMRIHEENSSLDQAVFAQIFDTYWRDPRFTGFFWTPNSADPALDEVRGRIVVLQDFDRDSLVYGLDYHAMNTQNDYVVSTTYDLYDKWLKVKGKLVEANAAKGAPHPFFLNFISGSTGVLPFFVASGKTLPPTNAPLLLTGLTTLTSASTWPDFPRVGCLWRMCSIAFDGTNPLTYRYLNNPANHITYSGIVMADYPGGGLIQALIGLNRR